VAGAGTDRYGLAMTPISFKRHRFPPEIIQHAVWLYARFTLSFRDVEDLLAERGIDVSNETVRRWFLKFGRAFYVQRHLLSRRIFKAFRAETFAVWNQGWFAA